MAKLSISAIQAGDRLPEQQRDCSTVQLFLYNAALWNAHRIHFDLPYATQAEGYPGLVVDGPLIGDWMSQCVLEWLGEAGELVSFEFSLRRAAYLGAPLLVGGSAVAVDPDNGLVTLDLHVRNAEGEVVAPGRAVVRFISGETKP